jgi:flavin-dependent dehydrogenase
MVVRAYAESLPGITIHNDARVVGLKTEPGVPAVVTGLHIKTSDGNENIAVDAVIDASGRFSKLALALKASGVAMQEDQRDSGIWYFTRHYRVRKGQTYPTVFGLPGAQFDDFTVGALPADNGYFTVTFQVYREDKALASALRDPDHFQRVCELTSQVAPWVDPTRARPTSKVHGFGQMDSFWRRTVIDGQPTVLNYFCVGDSCVRSNPKYGRGCTWSAIAAHAASDLLAEPMAPADRILQYENALEDMFRADWLTMRNIDRSTEKAFEVAVGLRQPAFGEQISQRVQSFVNDAIVIEPALFRDLWRGYNGLQNMSRWTLKPINWLRLTRAWFTRSAHSALLESQRGRASHRTMSGVTQGSLEV